jgi:hypothetical protein
MKKYGDELFVYAMAMQKDNDSDQAENMNKNGLAVNSDLPLIKPYKAQKGVPPPDNEWQTDHIIAKVYGGTCNGGANSYRNAQIWFQTVN